jgi:NADPH-dependent F420 reductase
MRVALLGGTGKLGLAFAVRLNTTGHEAVIGSRDAAKAAAAAQSVSAAIRGAANADAAEWCDLAVIAVPYAGHRILLESVRESLRGKIVVDATVPIDPSNLLQIRTETGKSAAEETAAITPEAEVFAAFQTVSHRVLRHPEVEHDVLVAGKNQRKKEVLDLIGSMGLHPVDAGPLEVAGHLERMTVLLLSINKANKVKESGIKITGL